ncbi:MAG: glycosyltransferase [Planctomycetota bacterium]
MKIAQLSFAETGGGAERVATDLHDCFLEAGHDAVLLTPRPNAASERAGVVPVDIDRGRSGWERALMKIDRRLARPRAALRRRSGYDDPHHPWTVRLLEQLPWKPDVLHLHNLHGNWFDLRQLGSLSRHLPTVVTLHDGWLPLDGPHWPMHVTGWDREALRVNHALREQGLRDAALTVVSPSRWMKGVWDASPWSAKVGDAVVIPNGIDLDIFRPDGGTLTNGDFWKDGEHRVLSVGISGRGKPSHTELAATLLVIESLKRRKAKAVIASVGDCDDECPRNMQFGSCRVHQPGRISDRARLASIYRSADVLFHPVHEDNAPLTVLEAMACGSPVVAPGVGGIPELVSDGIHGRLYRPGDHESRLAALLSLLDDDQAAQRMGRFAAERVQQHFDRRRMADDYLALYVELN